MTREEIIEHLDSIVGTYEILLGHGVNSDILDVDDIEAIREAISALSAEPCREADDYENEIADLHNRLDIAEYDKERYKEEITTLEAKNKVEWIPVSERLPKIADVYRVTRYYPNNVMNPIYLVDACAFDGSNTWYDDNRLNPERAYADNVIAWQENPEPYKAEKGGE